MRKTLNLLFGLHIPRDNSIIDRQISTDQEFKTRIHKLHYSFGKLLLSLVYTCRKNRGWLLLADVIEYKVYSFAI